MAFVDYIMMAFFAIVLFANFITLPSRSVESHDDEDEDYQWWAIR